MGRPSKQAGAEQTTGVVGEDQIDLGENIANNTPAPKDAPKQKRPNDDIDLSGFTYRGEFIGEQWQRYCNLVDGEFEEDEAGRSRIVKAGLPINESFDFVGYKVQQMRKRLYPKSTDQTTVCVGFKIVQEEPARETRSTLKNIKMLNDQLHGKIGAQPMIYYLLKKYN